MDEFKSKTRKTKKDQVFGERVRRSLTPFMPALGGEKIKFFQGHGGGKKKS